MRFKLFGKIFVLIFFGLANLLYANLRISKQEVQDGLGIFISESSSEQVKFAADKFAKNLGEIFRIEFVIHKCKSKPKGKSIYLRAETDDDNLNLGEEGYYISVEKDGLTIIGGMSRGLLYGVYSFLEDYLGCRWYSPDCPAGGFLVFRSV